MLDRNYILENIPLIKENCHNRNVKIDIEFFVSLEKQRKEKLQIVEKLRQERNENASTIKNLIKIEDKQPLIEQGKVIKEKLGHLEKELNVLEQQTYSLLLQIPNLTHPESPLGQDDSQNKEISRYNNIKKTAFTPKDHLILTETLGLIDFEQAAKVVGAKFYYLKNELALLELALVNYAFDVLVNKYDFKPIITPDLAKNSILAGTGYNPRGEETQIYSIEDSDLSLIATAEIPLGGLHANQILPLESLPLKYIGLSHCFRTEAGAYGKFSKGLYRVHQFTKAEMFIFSAKEQSAEMLELLKNIEIEIFNGLKIPFRVVDICSGDLGGPAYRKYDLEAWMYSRENEDKTILGNWGEITSASNCTDYQARRLNIKYKTNDGALEYVHTLNGTAIAISRALIAILENYQTKDGSIVIPKILHKYYLGKTKIIGKKT